MAKTLILYTGGTFGMAAPPSALSRTKKRPVLDLPDLSLSLLRESFRARVPEINELADCEIDILFNRDSAQIGPTEWGVLAERIQVAQKKYDGFVVLHGTDTLAYTACALSFLLRPCLKPVILTGAQRPLAAIRSDARRNLISAVEIAALGASPLRSQVLTLFDNRLFQGNRSRKRSATDFAGFESPRLRPLAEIGSGIQFRNDYKNPSVARGGPKLIRRFDQNVAMVHLTPGFVSRPIEMGLLPKISALILVVFASGTAPTEDPQFVQLLDSAKKKNIPVIAVTEGSHGEGAVPAHYAAAQALEDHGCLSAGDMTPECAYVKTSLLLGQPAGKQLLGQWMCRDLAGEGAAVQ